MTDDYLEATVIVVLVFLLLVGLAWVFGTAILWSYEYLTGFHTSDWQHVLLIGGAWVLLLGAPVLRGINGKKG